MLLQNDYTENLFRSIDTIIAERIKSLPYDQTNIVEIIDISGAANGIYTVSPDGNITEIVYSDNPTYQVGDKVYLIKTVANDRRFIVGLYMRKDGLNRINRIYE